MVGGTPDDAAVLFRLAAESAEAGTILHAVGEQAVTTRDIAENFGRHLGVPVTSVAPEAAFDHFGWIGAFFGVDMPASSAVTRERFGWQPTNIGLLDDLDQGHYFAAEVSRR